MADAADSWSNLPKLYYATTQMILVLHGKCATSSL